MEVAKMLLAIFVAIAVFMVNRVIGVCTLRSGKTIK
jgi:hypothetical protein